MVNEKNEATIRPVVTGRWIGKDWVILDGLKARDKVIVDNLIKLRPGTVVSPHAPGEAPAASCPTRTRKADVSRTTLMTRFFITRPIFASVLSIIIVLSGLVAALQLPIAQYPQIAPPTVLITATFRARARTLTKTVAAPIEEQLSGVENLLYFSSSADSSGTLTITAHL